MSFFKNIPSMELKKALKHIDIEVSGKKTMLVKYVVGHLDNLQVKDLKKMLELNKVEAKGSKKKLVKIIKTHLPLKLKAEGKAIEVNEKVEEKLGKNYGKKLGAGALALTTLGIAYYNKDKIKNMNFNDIVSSLNTERLQEIVNKIMKHESVVTMKKNLKNLLQLSGIQVDKVVAVLVELKRKISDLPEIIKDIVAGLWQGSTLKVGSAVNKILNKLNFSFSEKANLISEYVSKVHNEHGLPKLLAMREFLIKFIDKIKEKIPSDRFEKIEKVRSMLKENLNTKKPNSLVSLAETVYHTPKSSMSQGSFFSPKWLS